MKGGGHSYQGTSNAADSLLIWTRGMHAVTVHDAFVGAGCDARHAPQPAVSVGAGALWGQVYDAVTTGAGRYVQGGGCLTVGVAGLIQSGGFGSFSKAYGMAAASLLEAEIVTADGAVRIANACTHPDLFWALKGGGGGSFGVVTRLTLAHPCPARAFRRRVRLTIQASSDTAYRRLIGRIMGFYGDALFNPHWGEQIGFRPGNRLLIEMVFQGLDQAAGRGHLAAASWTGSPARRRISASQQVPLILDVPARQLLGSRRSCGSCPAWSSPTIARARPNQPVLGGQSGRSGPGPARLPIGLAAGLPAGSRPAARAWATPCSRRAGIGA